MVDDWRPIGRVFAQKAAEMARRLGVLSNPIFDEERFRLVDGDIAIDLYNPWHLTGCRVDPDERELARLLAPTELGAAGYLGRIDVVRRLLAAGVDPNASERDGVSPLQRTLAAWVTTDLHLEVVTALLDAGVIVDREQIGLLLAETAGSEVDGAIAELLTRRARSSPQP